MAVQVSLGSWSLRPSLRAWVKLSARCHGTSLRIPGSSIGFSREPVKPSFAQSCIASRGLENLDLTGLGYLIILASLVLCTQPESRLLKHSNMKFVVPGQVSGLLCAYHMILQPITIISKYQLSMQLGKERWNYHASKNIGDSMIKMTCLDDSCLARALLSNTLRTPDDLPIQTHNTP